MENIETFNFQSMASAVANLGLTITERDDEMKVMNIFGARADHYAEVAMDDEMICINNIVGKRSIAKVITTDLNHAICKAIAYATV